MSHGPSLNDQNFKQEVGTGLAVVDFFGDDWSACVKLAPVVEELAKEYAGRVKVASANVSEAMDTASELGVFGVPTLVFFKDGQEMGRLVGAAPKARIVKEIQGKLGVK